MKPLSVGLVLGSSVGLVGCSVGSVGSSVGSVGSSSSSPDPDPGSGDALTLDDKLERTIQQKIKNVN